jgi:outer membrane protein
MAGEAAIIAHLCSGLIPNKEKNVKLSSMVSATALAALLAPVALAQGQTSAPPAVAPTRVGILSARLAIVATAEGKQASAELQSQFAPRQNELESLRKQIEDAQKRLQEGQNTLPEEERVRLQRQIQIWTRTGQRKQQELEDDANFAQEELIGRIYRKMDEIVERYARENGYAVVFDVSGQNNPLVYASNQVDITQDIIRLYDQAHPVGAASSQPAQQQRPAAQPGQPRPKPPTQ